MLIVTTMLKRMAFVVCMLLSMLVLTGVPGASAGTEDRRVGSESAAVISGPPTLYRDPQHGSPVRGDPGDLLLIPWFNFNPSAYVIYQASADTTQRLSPPSPLPSGQTASSGKIVPVAVGTNAVKVQLPTVMTAGQSYAIWVVNPSGVSFDIKINDARPMWLSPGPLGSARQPLYSYVYRSTDRPSLNREIKIVGRNLQPAPGFQTKVRLARCLLDCGAADSIPGPVFVLTAADDGNPATQVVRYAATVKLPVDLPEGNYSVTISRDGVSWVPLDPVTRLIVLPDPVHSAPIDVSTFAGGATGP